MILPRVSNLYNPFQERVRNQTLENEDARNRKIGDDVELSSERLIIKSPDGTRWYLTVANDGTLATTAL